MPILNYTTTIKYDKTVSEIQQKLAKAGAQAILSEYDTDGIICAMSFRINTANGVISFRMPANIGGVHKILINHKSIPRKNKTKEQAANVTWRVIKDWVEAQLALTQAEIATITEVFLPYAQDASGKTVYQTLQETGMLSLTKIN